MTNDEKLAKIAEFVKANFSQRIADRLEAIDNDDTWTVNDGCGGNMDDAYSMGFEHGEASTLDCIKFILEQEQ